MNSPLEASIRRLLREVRRGKVSPAEAYKKLAFLPMEETGFARLDHQRALRQGIPEAILCPGKRLEQVMELLHRIAKRDVPALATRVPEAWGDPLTAEFPKGKWHADPGLFVVLPRGQRKPRGKARLVVASAGTADQKVAEEAAVTAESYGIKVARLYDVGVAGLHRVLAGAEVLRQARVIIVVAGMDGALPSVIGGLVAAPVIAVPTSIGYGASFEGVAALLTMLNSCAPGVVTVNIDNGFGAAVAACRLLKQP